MRAINASPGLPGALESVTTRITATANALGSGYRTPKWHDHETGETKGGTAPVYAGDVRIGKKGPIGIVHPANYSAMKDNHLHNTMLKAKG
jgi:hypothetical protein